MGRKYTKKDVLEKGHELSRWGKWGGDDECGSTYFIEPEDIVGAAKLVRKGKVFALGLPLDNHGPQAGLFEQRWNPIHTMLATGTDALAGNQDQLPITSDMQTTQLIFQRKLQHSRIHWPMCF